jgi:hypothetical protein
LEVSVEDPLDLDCLKRLTTEVSEWTSWGVPQLPKLSF